MSKIRGKMMMKIWGEAACKKWEEEDLGEHDEDEEDMGGRSVQKH